MGFLSFIFQKVTSLVNFFGNSMPKFSLDYLLFGKYMAFMRPYWSQADRIFPLHETLNVFTILLAFAVFMFVCWSIMRLINLIRGAG